MRFFCYNKHSFFSHNVWFFTYCSSTTRRRFLLTTILSSIVCVITLQWV